MCIRDRIDAEFDLTARLLQLLFQQPIAQRRPTQLAALQLRQAPLAALHRQQIDLLRQWRQEQRNDGISDSTSDGASKLLGQLFLSVNAIAGGVRNTG